VNPKIFLLNGPPNSGKDFGADILWYNGAEQVRFKDRLLDITKVIYGIESSAVFENRELKEKPSPAFKGLSPRQALIYVSEKVIKPAFGVNFFGEALCDKISEIMSIRERQLGSITFPIDFVVSDSGFTEEIDSLIRRFGAKAIVVIQIESEGCTFKEDSRGYVGDYAKEKGCLVYNVVNNKDASFERDLLKIYNESKGIYAK
jgi:hypothetical protein